MKSYIKPELFYERYEVSQHIADCAYEWVNSTDTENCYASADTVKLPGHPALFTEGVSGCDFTNPKEFENYCYQNSADGIKLHMS